MTMPCRITDERVDSHWDRDEEEVTTKSINDITLYDLMDEGIDVWLTKSDNFGYRLEIDIDDEPLVIDKELHPYAAESFAAFCRKYLASYEKLNGENNA